MTGKGSAAITIVSGMVSVLASQSEPREAVLDLPNGVAEYRSWRQLLRKPHPVSWELWIRCMAPTAADWEAAGKKIGPHTEHVIMVYGNPAAMTGLSNQGKALPAGAVIAKEKRRLQHEWLGVPLLPSIWLQTERSTNSAPRATGVLPQATTSLASIQDEECGRAWEIVSPVLRSNRMS